MYRVQVISSSLTFKPRTEPNGSCPMKSTSPHPPLHGREERAGCIPWSPDPGSGFSSHSQHPRPSGSPCTAVFNHKCISFSINTASRFWFFAWAFSVATKAACVHTPNMEAELVPWSQDQNATSVIDWGPGLAWSDPDGREGTHHCRSYFPVAAMKRVTKDT